jgi:transketolase
MNKVQGFTWTVDDVNLISAAETWGDVLVEAARGDDNIVALTADLGNSTKIQRFKVAFPARFFNVGIAEQNLMAVAAGLAATGYTPVVCSYATFATLRAAEFVRTDIGYGARNVKIVGALAGVAYGQGGPTHHALEDLALMRNIPGMVVLAPADGHEMGAALLAALAHNGPVYLRTGRGVEPDLPALRGLPFDIGKARELASGTQVAVLAIGPCVHEALKAARRAARHGVGVRVLNMASIKPLDREAVLAAVREAGGIITVEDHSVIGGLGSAVAEVIAESGMACALRRLGHQDCFLPMGVPEDLMHIGGFDEDAILAAIAAMAGVDFDEAQDWEDGK